MARTRRIKSDSDAHYHLMSRTNDRRFLFAKGAIKTELVEALKRTAEFCGITVKAYTAMDNHFHVVVQVLKSDEPVCADELLRRVGVLKGEKVMRDLAGHWKELVAAGYDAILKAEQDRLRARMHDVSEFIKLFKEEFNRIYKRRQTYCGSIWSGRFTSTLIQDGEYLARCLRYVVYNPVRAGMVTQAKDYRWSWCESDSKETAFAGSVPDEWCLKRVAQIGAGKVLGSVSFVMQVAFAHGNCFNSAGVSAHPVGNVGYSTHGWLLAKKAA